MRLTERVLPPTPVDAAGPGVLVAAAVAHPSLLSLLEKAPSLAPAAEAVLGRLPDFFPGQQFTLVVFTDPETDARHLVFLIFLTGYLVSEGLALMEAFDDWWTTVPEFATAPLVVDFTVKGTDALA